MTVLWSMICPACGAFNTRKVEMEETLPFYQCSMCKEWLRERTGFMVPDTGAVVVGAEEVA